ncbi:MAG: RAMP superfamily CRISPR-associated protein [Tetrasphaera sp.]
MTRLTYFRVVLEMTEQGGVTTPGPAVRDKPDALIDIDPFERPHIPGTSLAGALKERVSETAGPDRAQHIFGHVDGDGKRDDGTTDADASRMWVMNAEMESPDQGAPPTPSVRWSTAIDRERGAARLHTLRGVEMLPTGTRFVARLWLEDAAADVERGISRALVGWAPAIGRGVSTGHGQLAVREARTATLDLGNRHDLLLWLERSGPALVDELTHDPARGRVLDTRAADSRAPAQIRALRATLSGPLFVGDKRVRPAKNQPAARDGDTKALESRRDAPDSRERQPLMRGGRPLVPGTSIKGVLRSRCEFILNTVGIAACPTQCCGKCHTCRWFGQGGGEDASATSVGARAKVRIPDALVDGARMRTRTHVALDRWTGGVSQDTPVDAAIHPPGTRGGKLYQLKAPESGTFEIQLDLKELTKPEDVQRFLATIRLVVEDVNDGLVGFGAATTRGYGSVQLTPVGEDWLPKLAEAKRVLDQWRLQTGGGA